MASPFSPYALAAAARSVAEAAAAEAGITVAEAEAERAEAHANIDANKEGSVTHRAPPTRRYITGDVDGERAYARRYRIFRLEDEELKRRTEERYARITESNDIRLREHDVERQRAADAQTRRTQAAMREAHALKQKRMQPPKPPKPASTIASIEFESDASDSDFEPDQASDSDVDPYEVKAAAAAAAAPQPKRPRIADAPLDGPPFRIDPKVSATRGLLNDALSPMCIDGRWYPTAEHYYQSQKFVVTTYADLAARFSTQEADDEPDVGMSAASARTAGSRETLASHVGHDGTNHPIVLRPSTGWTDARRDAAMRRALEAKFATPLYRDVLLNNTGDRPLVYVTYRASSKYWGVNARTNVGANRIGAMLQIVRNQLRSDINNGHAKKKKKAKAKTKPDE